MESKGLRRVLSKILVLFMIAGSLYFIEAVRLFAVRPDQIEKDLSEKKKDLRDVKKEIVLTKEKEKKLLGKETSILGILQALESDLYLKGKELRKMEKELAQTKERLNQTQAQIASLSKGLERTRKDLFSRLNALYKMKRVPHEVFLLASESYHDLLRMDKYLKAVIQFDARLIETYRYQMALKERYQEELVQDQLQWERNILEVEKKKKEINRARSEKRELLKSIQNQKLVYQKLIRELEERAKELQSLVEKLEKERSLLAYGKAKIEPLRGKLIPPVQGKVISHFKERGQNGIEIKAPMGAEVRAVLPGKVLYADWFKGFGNLIIIDHGDHTFTVSGYCSELLKKAGDIVSQGETIALVGSVGSLKGPCLYFEIRHQGKPQDPLQWISQLDKVVLSPE
ncbi:MAG: murein hydrolase activator EnvC family protein [Thermodesulfobacteriota bacterium]